MLPPTSAEISQRDIIADQIVTSTRGILASHAAAGSEFESILTWIKGIKDDKGMYRRKKYFLNLHSI